MSEHPRCPCCGHEFKSLPRIDAMIAALGLTGMKKRLLTILASGRGRYLTVREIVDALYDDSINGGPDNAANIVRQNILDLRTSLEKYGLQIGGLRAPPGGYRLWAIETPVSHNGGYQLVEAAA